MGLRIIIGEPDFHVYELMREYLAGRGHEVSWAKTGADAVRLAVDREADLVFADALAPEVPGAKVCQQVKARRQGRAKAVLIGAGPSPLQGTGPAAGEGTEAPGEADGFLEKPVDVKELEKLLRALYPPRARAAARTAAEIKIAPLPEGAAEPLPRKLDPEGDLARVPVPKVLFHFHRYGRTGCLTLTWEKSTRKVFLRDGRPVYVVSNAASETLGRHLLATGRITLPQYHEILEAVLASGKQQTLLLIEKGFLSPHHLYEAMRDLTREKILRTFAWTAGRYGFQRGEFRIGEENLTPLEIHPLLLDGIRRHHNLTRLEEFFGRLKRHVPELEPLGARTESLSVLGPAQRKIVSMIDGRTPIARIVRQSPLNLTETFQVLYYLLVTDGMHFVGVREARRTPDRPRAARTARGEPQALSTYEALVDRTYRMLEGLDHFQVLGLAQDARTEEVRAAYLSMTRQFRPYDLYAAAPPLVREKADAIFERLTRAYEALLDDAGRARYLAELQAGQEADRMERSILDRLRGVAPAAPKPTPPPEEVAPSRVPPAERRRFVEFEPLPPPPPEEKAPADEARAEAPPEPEVPAAEVPLPPEETAELPAEEPLAAAEPELPDQEQGRIAAPPETLIELPEEPVSPPPLELEPEAPSVDLEATAEDEDLDVFAEETPADVEASEWQVAAAPPAEGEEIDPFAEPVGRRLDEQALDFDVFEIGSEPAFPGGNGSRPPAAREPEDWLATEPEDDLARLLDEGARVTQDMAAMMRGELRYQEAERLFEEGDFAGAVACLEDAIAAQPQEAEYRAFLAWALFHSAPSDPEKAHRARKLLAEALEANPALDQAHYYLGRIALAQRFYPEARRHFEQAIQSNPLHREAAAELARLEDLAP